MLKKWKTRKKKFEKSCKSIIANDRVRYFEFLKNNDSMGLAEWLKGLSIEEKERMEKFGYKI